MRRLPFRNQAIVFERYCLIPSRLYCVDSRDYAAHIPLFLYPFLNTISKTRPFEYLRLTSLGVIGALVKVCVFTYHREGVTSFLLFLALTSNLLIP